MNTKKPLIVKLFAQPALLWKAAAAIIFISLAAVFLLYPSIVGSELDNTTRYGFGGLLLIYGLFRLSMFYAEFKKLNHDDL